jgi:septal ring-binding cell division protein DamX
MGITTKTIRDIALTNLIIFGLAACSTSPAPWQQNDDPWVAKRASEANSVPSDDAVSDTTLTDSVLLAEPESTEGDFIVMEEPVAPEPEVIIAVVVDEVLTDEERVLAMSETDYVVQVYASKTLESAEAFKTSKGLENLTAVKTDRSGDVIYVLVDIYSDRDAANAAAPGLEEKTGSKPWVRSITGLQKIIAE